MGDEDERRATFEALKRALNRGTAVRPAAVPAMRLVFLDSGPLGMLASPHRSPVVLRCQQWARDLIAAGVRVYVPEIADYEVRRKLLHLGATTGIARLDRLQVGFDYAAITTEVMLRAAELWADSRRAGLPTASPDCPRRGLHPGRPGAAGGRPRRRGDRGHGQRGAPGPVRRRPALGSDRPVTVAFQDRNPLAGRGKACLRGEIKGVFKRGPIGSFGARSGGRGESAPSPGIAPSRPDSRPITRAYQPPGPTMPGAGHAPTCRATINL